MSTDETPPGLREWSRLHGGIDPTAPWVGGWLRLVHRLAGPLADRGVSPHTVTGGALAAAVLVPVAAAGGGAWPLAGAVLVLLSAVLDGVDGAVAVQRQVASAWGEVVDHLADRAADLLFVLALVVLGAPVWLGVVVAVLTLVLEGTRDAARAAGMSGVGAVTVWERPSRVIVTVCATASAGAPVGDPGLLATLAAATGGLLATVGLLQLLASVRRELRPRS